MEVRLKITVSKIIVTTRPLAIRSFQGTGRLRSYESPQHSFTAFCILHVSTFPYTFMNSFLLCFLEDPEQFDPRISQIEALIWLR